MSKAEIVWGAVTILFIAFQCVILRLDISDLKDKINDLEFKIDHKLTSPTVAESEEV